MYGVVIVSMTEQEQAEVDPLLAEFDFIWLYPDRCSMKTQMQDAKLIVQQIMYSRQTDNMNTSPTPD